MNEKLKELEHKLDDFKQEIETLKNDMSKKDWQYEGGPYYTLDGTIIQSYWCNDPVDNFRKQTGNCFRTEKEAEIYRERLIVAQMLRDIAEELNEGKEIDWNNGDQYKYELSFSLNFNEISQNSIRVCKTTSIYCLSDKFKDVVIKRIGEHRLTEYLKNY